MAGFIYSSAYWKDPLNVSRYKSPAGEGQTRFRLVVETDPCHKGTMQSRIIRQELLRYMADDPAFSLVGGVDFHKCRIYHDDTKWVAEFESVVQNPT